MCTLIPPPRRISCDLIVAVSRGAARRVRQVAPSTS
jgi:hypothetical protein